MSPSWARVLELMFTIFAFACLLSLISGITGVSAAVSDRGSGWNTMYGLTIWIASVVFATLVDSASHRRLR